MSRRRTVAVLCFVVCAWVAFAVYSQMAASHAADSRVQQLRAQNAALQSEIDARERAIGQASSDTWLAEQARRRGYVLPGEKVYVPVQPGSSLPPEGGVDRAVLSPLGPPPTAVPAAAPAAPVAAPAAHPATTPAAHATPTPYVVVVPPAH